MIRWFRSKPAADERDETIGRLTQALGAERAEHAKTSAQLEAANRWAANEQRARHRAEATHGYVMAQLRQAHAIAVSLAETERDKALARLTAAETANVDALLEKLNDTMGQLDKANGDLAVLRGDNANLRTQLGRECDEHRVTKRALADERNGKVVA